MRKCNVSYIVALGCCIFLSFFYSFSLRLHLGCGEIYMPGYVNIDFPPSGQTVQKVSCADRYADITTLIFPVNSVDEIRLHHVFEHFDRPTALALLCNWSSWLKEEGKLIIETPDFMASLNILIDHQSSYQEKQIVLRHLFGSHEAHWAIHCDGWYEDKFIHVLETVGFADIHVAYTRWKMCANIIITARKKVVLQKDQLIKNAHTLLRESLVDSSGSEERLWHIWCRTFDALITF